MLLIFKTETVTESCSKGLLITMCIIIARLLRYRNEINYFWHQLKIEPNDFQKTECPAYFFVV